MNSRERMSIYGEDIPHCVTFKYLGCMFDKKGINWELHHKRLIEKTKQMLHFFTSVGYNSGGFRERTRLTLFKTFLRPLWEYALCIMPNMKARLNELNRIQHRCLAQMFSVDYRCSRAGLQALTSIPEVAHRWLELSAKWHYRLRHKNEQHMATIARLNTRGNHLKRRSCFATFGHNPILQYMDQMKLTDQAYELKDAIIDLRYKLLNQTKKESYFTAGISISLDCKPRVMYSLSRQPKKIARRCTLWMLGRVPGRPKRCMLCNENDEHGWRHFEHCLGMSELKNTIWQKLWRSGAAMVVEAGEYMLGMGQYLQ